MSSSSSSSSLSSSSSSSASGADWCWGHDTAVDEAYAADFADGVTDGNIAGSGDSETLELTQGQEWVSQIVPTYVGEVSFQHNKYAVGSGVCGTAYYKTGATREDCEADDWHEYDCVNYFVSLGWVQMKITK